MPPAHIFEAINQERNEIRLLHLDQPKQARNDSSYAFTGRLQCVSLSDAPEYNALSYVWGDPIPVSAISLEDGSCIPIAANLVDALLHISAIESMQADDIEKSWQVQMMDQIYSRATKTLVWLGPSTKASHEAMQHFSDYGQKALQYGILDLFSGTDHTDSFEFGYERWTLGPPDTHGQEIIDRVIRDVHDPRTSSPLDMLSSIMHKSWWSRIWVLQELLLSPNPVFIYGYQTITARDFVASVRLYEAALTVHYGDLLSKPRDASTVDHELALIKEIGFQTQSFHTMADVPALVLYTTQLRQRERSKFHGIEEPYFGLGNLWDLVQDIILSTRRLEAFDPRDRIYTLLGIARLSRVDATTIKPNYALTFADVYAQATCFFMRYTGSRMLDLASHARKRASVPNLPSWAIDWSLTNLMVRPFPEIRSPGQDLFQVSRSPRSKNILQTSATLYGRLKTMKVKSPAITWTTDSQGEHHLRILDYLLYYVSALDEHLWITSNGSGDSLEQLICAMIFNSTTIDMTTEKLEYSPSTLFEASVYIRDKIVGFQRHETQSNGDTRGSTGKEVTDSRPKFDISLFSATSMIAAATEPSIDPNVLPYALCRIRDTLRSDKTIFVAGGELIGLGPQATRDGDVLIGFENDALIFVVRMVEDNVYESIGKACVPRIDFQRAASGTYEVGIINLC